MKEVERGGVVPHERVGDTGEDDPNMRAELLRAIPSVRPSIMPVCDFDDATASSSSTSYHRFEVLISDIPRISPPLSPEQFFTLLESDEELSRAYTTHLMKVLRDEVLTLARAGTLFHPRLELSINVPAVMFDNAFISELASYLRDFDYSLRKTDSPTEIAFGIEITERQQLTANNNPALDSVLADLLSSKEAHVGKSSTSAVPPHPSNDTRRAYIHKISIDDVPNSMSLANLEHLHERILQITHNEEELRVLLQHVEVKLEYDLTKKDAIASDTTRPFIFDQQNIPHLFHKGAKMVSGNILTQAFPDIDILEENCRALLDRISLLSTRFGIRQFVLERAGEKIIGERARPTATSVIQHYLVNQLAKQGLRMSFQGWGISQKVSLEEGLSKMPMQSGQAA